MNIKTVTDILKILTVIEITSHNPNAGGITKDNHSWFFIWKPTHTCTKPHICTWTSTSCRYESTHTPLISCHGLQRCRKVTASFISSVDIITDSVLCLLTETFPHRQALKLITPTRGPRDYLRLLGWLRRSYFPMSLKHSYRLYFLYYIVILRQSNLMRK